jgi:hypothetical protein
VSNARAVRYRRLALAAKVKADADLLLKLADECDRGLLCVAEWRSARPSFKNEQAKSRRRQGTAWVGPHSMTDVENLSQTGPPRARQRYLIAAKL